MTIAQWEMLLPSRRNSLFRNTGVELLGNSKVTMPHRYLGTVFIIGGVVGAVACGSKAAPVASMLADADRASGSDAPPATGDPSSCNWVAVLNMRLLN